VPNCTKCPNEAITFIRYNGAHLCADHFIEYVDRRAKKEMRRQVDLDGMSTVAVALSGGKDSSVTLAIVAETLKDRRDIKVVAITVDEGVGSYRPKTMAKAEELTERLGVEHQVVSFESEFGITLDAIASQPRAKTPCTYCGVLRRWCLNKAARAIGADVLATGLNLDDTAQSILMNFTRGDVGRMARFGPHEKVQPGLIPRIQPLRQIPEKEAHLYAIVKDLPFSADECPYAGDALRNEYRDMVDRLEAGHPGSKFSVLASYDAIRPLLADRYHPARLGTCACGEPTINERCMACVLLDEVRKG
jgi:uncharacterized protein (TIGR00269 family)